MKLHTFFRSSASWRVRIALLIKGINYDALTYRLRLNEQRAENYLALNPQGLVPSLELDDGNVIIQSMAICEYLDDIYPENPILPKSPLEKAYVRSLAQIIACDVHPIQNLKILNKLRKLGHNDDEVNSWAADIINEGLLAYEELLKHKPIGKFSFGDTMPEGKFSYGNDVTLADICLIPQLGNARRFGATIPPRLLEIEAECMKLDAFIKSAPNNQPDAE